MYLRCIFLTRQLIFCIFVDLQAGKYRHTSNFDSLQKPLRFFFFVLNFFEIFRRVFLKFWLRKKEILTESEWKCIALGIIFSTPKLPPGKAKICMSLSSLETPLLIPKKVFIKIFFFLLQLLKLLSVFELLLLLWITLDDKYPRINDCKCFSVFVGNLEPQSTWERKLVTTLSTRTHTDHTKTFDRVIFLVLLPTPQSKIYTEGKKVEVTLKNVFKCYGTQSCG